MTIVIAHALVEGFAILAACLTLGCHAGKCEGDPGELCQIALGAGCQRNKQGVACLMSDGFSQLQQLCLVLATRDVCIYVHNRSFGPFGSSHAFQQAAMLTGSLSEA